MFTGIVSGVGTVLEANRRSGGLELEIESAYPDLEPGESVAVDGACLTVEAVTPRGFRVQVVSTTMTRTGFGEYAVGRRVNLERALRVGDRLGGHLVQAHVDGLGSVDRVSESPNGRLLDLGVPSDVARITVPLGSITVDGVSLTVNSKPSPTTIQISLIPFTLQHTTLGLRTPGDRVHLEADTIGKYVDGLLGERRER